MSHLDDLLTKWDALSKGETPTTHAIREAVARDAGAGWFWTQDEWAEWSNELANLIPEDDVSSYANVDGSQESIIRAVLAAYAAEREATVSA